MRRLPSLLLVALVVLAGCNGIALPGSSDGTPTAAPNGSNDTGTPALPGENVTAGSVTASALDAIDEVRTYRVRVDQRTDFPEIDRTANATVDGAFNRSARDAALERNQTVDGLSFTVETYVDGENGTLYQYSPAYEREFGSAWVKRDLPGNGSAAWDRYDTLSRQRALLNASNLTLEGVQRVNGTDAYVLSGTVEDDRLPGLGFGSGGLDASNVSVTFHVSAENGTLVRSTVTFEGTQQAHQRTLAFERTVEIRFHGYGAPVTVDLPDAASDAVAAGNRTTTPA